MSKLWGYSVSGISRAILLFSLSFLPFIQPFHLQPRTSYHTEALAFLVGVLLLLSCKLQVSSASKILLVFTFLVALQEAYLPALYLLWFVLLLEAARSLSFTSLRFLLYGFCAGGILNTLLGVYQFVHGHEVFGALGQSNHYATYLMISVIAFLYFRNLLFIVPLFGLLISDSRSAILYLVFFTFCYFLYVHKQAYKIWLPILLSVLIVGGITVVQANDVVRLWLWKEAVVAFFSAPLLGIGIGNFAIQYNNQMVTHSHNLIFQLLVETGVVGLTLILLWAFAVLRSIRIKPLVLVTSLGIIGIHSFLEYPLWYSHFLGITAVLIGSLQSTNNEGGQGV
jgi:hypothetical protein